MEELYNQFLLFSVAFFKKANKLLVMLEEATNFLDWI